MPVIKKKERVKEGRREGETEREMDRQTEREKAKKEGKQVSGMNTHRIKFFPWGLNSSSHSTGALSSFGVGVNELLACLLQKWFPKRMLDFSHCKPVQLLFMIC